MITYNEIIEALQMQDDDKEVYFDFCRAFPLLEVASWRGVYSEPAIDWAVNRRSQHFRPHKAPTVKELREYLTDKIGTPLYGYKGGEFRLKGQSLLYVDGDGEYTSTVITGVVRSRPDVILVTQSFPW